MPSPLVSSQANAGLMDYSTFLACDIHVKEDIDTYRYICFYIYIYIFVHTPILHGFVQKSGTHGTQNTLVMLGKNSLFFHLSETGLLLLMLQLPALVLPGMNLLFG